MTNMLINASGEITPVSGWVPFGTGVLSRVNTPTPEDGSYIVSAVGVGEPALVLPGTSGSYVSTPDHASLDFTGSFTLTVYASSPDWTPAAVSNLFNKWESLSGFDVFLQSSGQFQIRIGDGTLPHAVVTGSPTLTNGIAYWLEFNFNNGTKQFRFRKSTDPQTTPLGSIAWSTVSQEGVPAAGNPAVNNQEVRIGCDQDGVRPFNGSIFKAYIADSTGTVVASPDFTQLYGGETNVIDSQGKTWTPAGSAVLSSTASGMKQDVSFVLEPGQYAKCSAWIHAPVGMTVKAIAESLTDTGAADSDSLGTVSVIGNGAWQKVTTATFTRPNRFRPGIRFVAPSGTFYLDKATLDNAAYFIDTPYSVSAAETIDGSYVVNDYQYGYKGLLLGSGSAFTIEKVDGLLGPPNVTVGDSDRAYTHGGIPGRHTLQRRVVQATVKAVEHPRDAIESRIDEMTQTFVPSSALTHYELYFRRPNKGLRFIRARVTRPPRVTSDYELGRGKAEFVTELTAVDPRIYSLPKLSQAITINPGSASASVAVSNALQTWDEIDQFKGSPPVLTIVGPALNPRVANAECANRSVKCNINLTAGQVLLIDTGTREVRVDGVLDYGIIPDDNQWWELLKNTNNITYSRTGTTGTSTCTLSWYPAHMR